MTLTLNEVRELLEKYDLHPKKSLGQNFVIEPNTIRQIIGFSSIVPGDHVLEVGPGLGSLTLALLEEQAEVIAVEIDDRLVKVLSEVVKTRAGSNLRIIHGDIMKLELNKLLEARSDSWKLVANLPYNISTPLICELLEKVPSINEMVVMVQKEAAERLVAKAGQRAYGIPSIKVDYYAKARIIASIPASVFLPKPRVESSLVEIKRKTDFRSKVNPEILFSIIRIAFNQRRKMLRSSLRELFDEKDFYSVGIDSSERAENLDLKDWEVLAKRAETTGGIFKS